jgi:hypothetical protein
MGIMAKKFAENMPMLLQNNGATGSIAVELSVKVLARGNKDVELTMKSGTRLRKTSVFILLIAMLSGMLASVPISAVPANATKQTTCTCNGNGCGTSASLDFEIPLDSLSTSPNSACGAGGCSCVKSAPCSEQLPALLPASGRMQSKTATPSSQQHLIHAMRLRIARPPAIRFALHDPPHVRCITVLPPGDRAPPTV